MRTVFGGRTQKDRDAIKRDTGGRFLLHEPSDLDAFTCFAGPGRQRERAVEICRLAASVFEQVTLGEVSEFF
jgi:hypothetical protein